jgi:uncharacterized protein GlcG (DUF336 family)
MPKTRSLAAIATAAILLVAPFVAYSQELITQKLLSFDLANGIAQAALASCRSRGDKCVVTVLDEKGLVKVMLRDDGTGPQSPDTSRRKAFTALASKGTSSAQAKIWENQKNPNIGPDRVALAGGVAIKVGDDVIGAIGIAGGRRDEEDCMAAINKFANKLK